MLASIRKIGGKVMKKLTIVIARETYDASSGRDLERISLL
jgi:hypothetical protein